MIKILNFGSLNYDYRYTLDHFVQEKETQAVLSFERSIGGKGLNQSIALAKAGGFVYHAGCIGPDGEDMKEMLQRYHVDASYVKKIDTASGHAIIQLAHGENAIMVYGGANKCIDEAFIDAVLLDFEKDDILVCQNEISCVGYLLHEAHLKGMKVVFNVSPIDASLSSLDYDDVDLFMMNELEAAAMTNNVTTSEEEMLDLLTMMAPDKEFVITRGEYGSLYGKGEIRIEQESISSLVVDTTGAGDTYLGFFVAAWSKQKPVAQCMVLASVASAMEIRQMGVGDAIPTIEEVLAFRL